MVALQVPVHSRPWKFASLTNSTEDLAACELQNVHLGCRTDLPLRKRFDWPLHMTLIRQKNVDKQLAPGVTGQDGSCIEFWVVQQLPKNPHVLQR